MANGDVTASRLGLINLGGSPQSNTDTNALFLKVFANEILTTFEEATVMKDLHTVRTISSGKSAQFPVTGIATAKYHTVGEDILESSTGYTSRIKHGEKIINIDDVLLASTFIPNIDEMKNHYDVRSIYAKELGKALAKRFDIATMKTLMAAAGASSEIGLAGGTTLDVSNGECAGLSTAANIISTITTIAQKFDENDVPSDDRFLLLTPESYYKLVSANTDAVSFTTTTEAVKGAGYSRLENPLVTQGLANLATARIAQVAGISVFKTNHLKDIIDEGNLSSSQSGADNDDGGSGVKNDVHADAGVGYNANFTGLQALAGTKQAIGTVKLMDLTTESEYLMTKQGTALVAKYAMGHGVLRPECAIKVVA